MKTTIIVTLAMIAIIGLAVADFYRTKDMSSREICLQYGKCAMFPDVFK